MLDKTPILNSVLAFSDRGSVDSGKYRKIAAVVNAHETIPEVVSPAALGYKQKHGLTSLDRLNISPSASGQKRDRENCCSIIRSIDSNENYGSIFRSVDSNGTGSRLRNVGEREELKETASESKLMSMEEGAPPSKRPKLISCLRRNSSNAIVEQDDERANTAVKTRDYGSQFPHRKLRFYPLVNVMGVPTLREYKAAGIADRIWCTPSEIETFKNSAKSDVLRFVRHSNKVQKGMSFKSILNLYLTEGLFPSETINSGCTSTSPPTNTHISTNGNTNTNSSSADAGVSG
mmetsp:Transcript_24604/g.41048  ORF Transcript_24604/g.41048 Transcript_24604/m.41048 type:complete len:290 (-) Transcript_24604:588-1457(-)